MPSYRGDDFPDWPAHPWHFPVILWTVPYWPVRLYLHAGDRALFWLWWHSRRFMWALADFFHD